MAYDEDLANRLRELLADEPAVTEKKMFGGLAFLLHGHMTVAASGQGGLMARIDPADADSALADPHAAPMEMRGRTMDGWIRVAPDGMATKRQLAAWVKRSVAFAKTLPPKDAKAPRARAARADVTPPPHAPAAGPARARCRRAPRRAPARRAPPRGGRA